MRIQWLLLPLLALTSAACDPSSAAAQAANSAAIKAKPPVNATGSWQPPAGFMQVRIWPGVAPNRTFRPQPPESVETYDDPGAVGGRRLCSTSRCRR
jgi:hypothetical protein